MNSMEARLVENRHAAARLVLDIATRFNARHLGVIAVVDVAAQKNECAEWITRTLPANVAVLSVTTRGEIASEKDDRAAPSVALTGVATRGSDYAISGRVHTTLALLDPRWLHAVLGMDAHDCTNRRMAMADCVPVTRCDSLHAEVRGALGAKARMAALTAWVAELVQAASGHVAASADPAAQPAVVDLPDHWKSLSQRQQERVFRRSHGISKARYDTIERFQQVAAGLAFSDQPGASLAADTGFADQSHMVHSVRQLSGFTPMQLRQQLSSSPFARVYGTMPGFERQLVL